MDLSNLIRRKETQEGVNALIDDAPKELDPPEEMRTLTPEEPPMSHEEKTFAGNGRAVAALARLRMQTRVNCSSANGAHILVIGPPGCGKTQLVTTCEGPTLVLEADVSGAAVLDSFIESNPDILLRQYTNKIFGLSSISNTSAKRSKKYGAGANDLRDANYDDSVLEAVKDDIEEWKQLGLFDGYIKNVVVDSLTSWDQIISHHVLAQDPNAGLYLDKTLYPAVQSLTTIFLNSLFQLPCNVIVLAHQKNEYDPEGKRIIKKKVYASGQQNRDNIAGFFDATWYMERENGRVPELIIHPSRILPASTKFGSHLADRQAPHIGAILRACNKGSFDRNTETPADFPPVILEKDSPSTAYTADEPTTVTVGTKNQSPLARATAAALRKVR